MVESKEDERLGCDRLVSLLKNSSARLVYEHSWLYYDEDSKTWIVQRREPYQKSNRCQYTGECLYDAVQSLRQSTGHTF